MSSAACVAGIVLIGITTVFDCAFAAGHVLDNGRVHVVFADPATGFSTADNDRVDNIAWITSTGASTGNLASNGGPLHCNDPLEFFGQSYGDGGDSHPFLVVSSVTSRWKSPAGSTLTGKTKVNTGVVCDFAPDGGTSTTYTLEKSAGRINQMTVQRSFSFKTVSNTSDLRAYVPRLPIGAYGAVSWPNAAGVVQTGNAGSCSGGCIVTDWNGTWFAEQTSAGQGLVVIRNPKSGPPALLVFDNDSFSNSNNSAVALRLPTGGWLGTYRETENLCFFDATTWPASRQAKGLLPTGCTTP